MRDLRGCIKIDLLSIRIGSQALMMKQIVYFLFIVFALPHPLIAFAPKQTPSVLVVGHGFMGANHVKTLELLQQEGKVTIVGVVDTDPVRLKGIPYPSFQDVQAACSLLHPDIVVVVSNTQTHYDVIQQILDFSDNACLPALLVEKPLVETAKQARELALVLKEKKYEREIPITCGYLFRNSPIINQSIDYIHQNRLKLEKVTVQWQKQRAPTRPSAGVHIDEATHPVDLVLNRIFPALGIASEPLSITCFKRDYNISIVDEKQQKALYVNEPDKLIPLALVEYEIKTPTISIQSFSSFATPPQVREITLHCSNSTALKLVYDKEQTDYLEIISPTQNKIMLLLKKPNKLLEEWRAFLDYYHSGVRTSDLASIQDMVTDIEITESLGTIPVRDCSQL